MPDHPKYRSTRESFSHNYLEAHDQVIILLAQIEYNTFFLWLSMDL